ncbi:LOW QUALITY PROTEIN: cold shock domain-containing protein C2 [Onychostruthus taczanowskii]|uniref:LOW QUALITY PROTEIN: cold shock domain-containing protein C2 n=1 Tax=Onychostruthus taczanowskii TaxID=356909 RepID=UPI001B7FF62F|nr:LOW QUALITY PROTEIN: cold shock domain-containing protein C2 [Onychostruthus taczanowskii]
MHTCLKGKSSLHDGFSLCLSFAFVSLLAFPHGLSENWAAQHTKGAFNNQSIKVTSSRPTHLGILSPAAYPPSPKTEEPTDPTMSSEPSAPPAVPPLHSPKSPVWPTFPFQREGSRIWERGNLLLRDLPSPLPTKRTRTYSATARASAGPIFKGVCKQFSRSQGHGFITPENGTEDIFVHVSDIEGEYVPVEGDEVTYKVCPIPPKNQKFQAVEVVLTNLAPHTKHETWSGQIIGS